MKIITIHPSNELYGSDRSYAAALEAISRRWPDAKIEVFLPERGPLDAIPPFDRLRPVIRRLWILRRRDILRSITVDLITNLKAVVFAFRKISGSDITYIDTIVVFDFIVAAGLFRRKKIYIHVREIPTGIEMRIFRALLVWSRASILFNSRASQQAFDLPSSCKSSVVYNGFEDPGAAPAPDFDGNRPLRLLVIGRINGWKGQELAVAALQQMTEDERKRVQLRIVGGVYGDQIDFLSKLEHQIAAAGLGEVVTVAPFEDDPSNSYRATDVLLVPSRKPEPFGRVAIEAMAFARPVIASNHGGLTEIVEDGETGLLVEPNKPDELCAAIRLYLATPSEVGRQGNQGRERFLARFTNVASENALCEAIKVHMEN